MRQALYELRKWVYNSSAPSGQNYSPFNSSDFYERACTSHLDLMKLSYPHAHVVVLTQQALALGVFGGNCL